MSFQRITIVMAVATIGLLHSLSATAFTATQSSFAVIRNVPTGIGNGRTLTLLEMAKSKKKKQSKGFGKETTKPQKSSSTETSSSSSSSTTTTTTTTNTISTQQQQQQQEQEAPLSGGASALAKLRRAEAEKRNEELRAIQNLKSVDTQLQENPNAAAIPEQVAMRMGKRMLPFVGVPLFGLMGTFVAFWYFATYKNVEFQPVVVAVTSIVVLLVGLLGITYSVMSASWDVEEEGSALGFSEFKSNLGNIQDGLKRSRENAILREKMAGLPEEEIARAIDDMEKRDEKKKRERMDLKERLERDLE